MGEVYLARHPRLPRHDALKVLPLEVSADREFRERFHREADLAAALYHPHIVGLHDRGEFAGKLWIAMDYVDGPDTAALLGAHAGRVGGQRCLRIAWRSRRGGGLRPRQWSAAPRHQTVQCVDLTTENWPAANPVDRLRDRPPTRRGQRADRDQYDRGNGELLRPRTTHRSDRRRKHRSVRSCRDRVSLVDRVGAVQPHQPGGGDRPAPDDAATTTECQPAPIRLTRSGFRAGTG
jgi:hypothetical protein